MLCIIIYIVYTYYNDCQDYFLTINDIIIIAVILFQSLTWLVLSSAN